MRAAEDHFGAIYTALRRLGYYKFDTATTGSVGVPDHAGPSLLSVYQTQQVAIVDW